MWLTCWITNNTHTHIQRYLLLLDTISLLKLVILSSDYDLWYIVNLSRFIMGQYTFSIQTWLNPIITRVSNFFGYHGHFNSFAFSYNIYVIFFIKFFNILFFIVWINRFHSLYESHLNFIKYHSTSPINPLNDWWQLCDINYQSRPGPVSSTSLTLYPRVQARSMQPIKTLWSVLHCQVITESVVRNIDCVFVCECVFQRWMKVILSSKKCRQ